jgi:kynurenine 3-monooxygenase
MMIALPNGDGTFTCTLFWPHEGDHSFASVDASGIRAFFKEHYPDVVDYMPGLETEYSENPIGALCTVRCRPWNRNHVVLIGDAAHAVVPFYGQGANASFEDAEDLAERMIASPDDLHGAAERYYCHRVEHANAIADMALANFLEMRDHTGKRSFRVKKALERALHRTFDSRFLPLYEMVSFTTIPYADARRKAARQWEMVGTVLILFIAALIVGVSLLLA